jgi:phosphomethylpyrimidine synthase
MTNGTTSANGTQTQKHYARRGVITDQMRTVAEKEGLEPELVRREVATGRLVIPANINHASLSPIGIGSVAGVR